MMTSKLINEVEMVEFVVIVHLINLTLLFEFYNENELIDLLIS
jgi:hypothetical protein